MAKQTIVIDPGHNKNVLPAKQSPDGLFKEYIWNWEMSERLYNRLKSLGYDVRMTITKAFSDSATTKDSLTARANTVNKICKEKGTANCMLVSVHCNAAGNGGWYKARGWSIFCAANKSGQFVCSQASKDLANSIFDAVAAKGFTMRKPSPNQKYWPGNFTVLTATNCKAVLMENFFYDNKEDVVLLQSEDTKSKLIDAWVGGILKYMGEPLPTKPETKPDVCPCCGQDIK